MVIMVKYIIVYFCTQFINLKKEGGRRLRTEKKREREGGKSFWINYDYKGCFVRWSGSFSYRKVLENNPVRQA